MKVGDKIRVDWHALGYWCGSVEDFVVEEFRYTLGIFKSEDHRKAGNFTPLCELYYDGPESEDDYISNYGSYRTNQVQGWSNLP